MPTTPSWKTVGVLHKCSLLSSHNLVQEQTPKASNRNHMARQLLHTTIPLSTSQVGLAAMTLLLCAFALFMCASHSRKWRRWSACYGSYYEHDPVIQLNTDAMILGPGCHGIQLTNRDESMFSGEQQGASVWQKNILMGGKCQLPDFSGVIIYDSDGKIINPGKNPRPLLTWK